MNKDNKNTTKNILRYMRVPFLAMFSLIFLIPFIFLLLSSFAYSWRWPDILPQSYSMRSWQILMQEPQLFSSLGITIVIGATVALLNLILALPAAKALSHYQFWGKSAIEGFLMLPILVPALAVAMGIHLTMIRLGLADMWVGVILVHLIPTLPYSLRILRSGYDRLGTKWADQARSLGVYPGRVFWTISLPFLLPSVRSVVLLAFVISISQYVLTLLIGGGNVVTLALIYFPFLTSVDRSVMAAFSVLFALLPLLFLGIVECTIRLLLPGKLHHIKGDLK